MSQGFRILTGTGETIALASEDEAPGVIVDYFYFDRPNESTTTRNYPGFPGTALLAIITPATNNGTHDCSASVTGTSLTITTRLASASISNGLTQPVWITVLGV
jgi:hypothetical protein